MTPATDILEARSVQATRWTVAALLVVALHVGGGALALMNWHEEDTSDDAASAIVVQLSPISTAAPMDMPDLTPGPLLEEVAPQMAKRAPEEVVDKEIPRVDQSPLAPNPEVLVPIPKPEEKKVEKTKEKDELRQEENPTEAAVVPLTSAPPKVEAKPALTVAAPTSGRATVDTRGNVSWQNSLVSHLNRYKRYPGAARARGVQGVVNVQFSIDRGGKVMASRIASGSGSPVLDEEALAVIQRASPLPAPPATMPGATVDLTLPIYFRIK